MEYGKDITRFTITTVSKKKKIPFVAVSFAQQETSTEK